MKEESGSNPPILKKEVFVFTTLFIPPKISNVSIPILFLKAALTP